MNETQQPLLDLKNVIRHYQSGETTVRALDGVSLTIWPGEFVAIMGQSGSGKTTLMNIIGCLDKPTGGAYHVQGQDVADRNRDGLAALRRATFGFVFQRYNLLATATAEENVEIPATYIGMKKTARVTRARALLTRLGLGERAGHRPAQLSGGQQQRVAIARALMNNPPIILADEPTGALDSRSGADVMTLLKDLHGEGRTIILITHDEKVAAHAKRVIRISDGKITDDNSEALSPSFKALPPLEGGGLGGGLANSSHNLYYRSIATTPPPNPPPLKRGRALKEGEREILDSEDNHGALTIELSESIKTALRALRANLFRTALTLLGIVIGVAAVVTMLAVGQGSKQKVLTQISAMGTNLLTVRPGAPGVRASGDIATLVPADADAIAGLTNVDAVSANRSGHMTVRFGNIDYATTIQGVGASYPSIQNWPLATGTFFTDRDIAGYAPVVVLGQTVLKDLFPNGDDPLGKYIIVHNIPFLVIGTMSAKGATAFGSDQDDVAFVPLTVGLIRLFGKTYASDITVKVTDVKRIDETQDAITALLKDRHRTEDFQIRNMASILDMATATQNTLTILLGTVAAISLLVGGIGVMNIMLVSVTERTREIGIRMATGARMRDILLQFNTEAAVVCIIGGVLGIIFGLIAGGVVSLFDVAVVFSLAPALLAFSCAVLTGLVFGYLPARKAALLDPVVALSSE